MSAHRISPVMQALLDKGLLVEAGWEACAELLGVAKLPTEAQRRDMRYAFFAGAQYFFEAVLFAIEEGDDPTPDDLHRMQSAHEELARFGEEFKRDPRIAAALAAAQRRGGIA